MAGLSGGTHMCFIVHVRSTSQNVHHLSWQVGHNPVQSIQVALHSAPHA